MLRISKLTDYATVVLGALAAEAGTAKSAAQLAADTRIALPTVSKVLKALLRGGLVGSTRGSHGGYQLSRPAALISAADIIDALEGPVGLTECTTHPGSCDRESSCRSGDAWQKVNVAVRRALQDVTLPELTGLSPEPAMANPSVRAATNSQSSAELAAALRAGTLRARPIGSSTP
jgi:FeS assembly SUF system regulator